MKPEARKPKSEPMSSDWIVGSKNVFKDLGFADAEIHQQKVNLALKISEVIDRKRVTQSQAAKILGIDQPKISKLTRGVVKEFSIERLMIFLSQLGEPHEITAKAQPAPGSTAFQAGRYRIACAKNLAATRYFSFSQKNNSPYVTFAMVAAANERLQDNI